MAGGQEVRIASGEEIPTEALADFFRRTWDPGATADAVRRSRAEAARSNPVVPGALPPDVAYLVDGAVVGYLGTLPVRFWDGTTERDGHWLKGFEVLPEYRNGPVGFYLLRTMNKEVGLAGSVLVADAARKLLEQVGYRHVGPIPDRLLVLRGGRLLGRVDPDRVPGVPDRLRAVVRGAQRVGAAALAGAVGGAALALGRGLLRTVGARGIDVARERPEAESVDELWREVRPALAAAPARGGGPLLWRYGRGGGERYAFLAARERGSTALAGLAVLKLPTDAADPRLEGLRVATLSDVVVHPSRRDVALALLCGAASEGRRAGGDALLAAASHPMLGRALARTGFAKVGTRLHCYVRPGPDGPELPERADEWWLTRGDGGADYGL
jgi:hypothetical protein